MRVWHLQVAIGHNEDASPLIQGRCYIVSATIHTAKQHRHIPNLAAAEQFTVYTYPGQFTK